MNWNTPKGRLLKVFLIFSGILADYGLGIITFYSIWWGRTTAGSGILELLFYGLFTALTIDLIMVIIISICDSIYTYIKYGTTDEDEIEEIKKEISKSAVDLDYLTAEKELNMFLAKNKG